MKKVKVYTTPTCPYCQALKEWLGENNYQYENYDVSVDEKARDKMIEISGQMGVPVIDIEGEIVIGFDKEKIAELLNIK